MPDFFASLGANSDFPHSEQFDDRYYLDNLGLYESQSVSLNEQQLLEQHLGHKGPFVVAEMGFGSGLNFLALFDLWCRSRRPEGPLIYISTEQYPLHPQDLQKSLQPWLKQIPGPISRLLGHYKSPTPGLNLFFFGPEKILLILLIGEASEQLSLCDFSAQHWMLDGFAPAKNPTAWSEELLSEVTRLSAPGATLSTFTAAGIVRNRLEQRQWHINKIPGFGRKRHRIEGVYQPQTRPQAAPRRSLTLFGGGIAGQSIAFFHQWLGGSHRIVSCPGPAASPAPWIYAQFKPRRQWDAEQIFSVQSHQFSAHFFKDLSTQAAIGYGPAPIMMRSAVQADIQERFDRALLDPRFSEILQRVEHGWSFPLSFGIDGAKTLAEMACLSGQRPEIMSFQQAHKLLHEESLRRSIAIATSFTAPSLISGMPEAAILRGEITRTDSNWGKPSHERYAFQPTPKNESGVRDSFVGFRSSHQNHLPLFGTLSRGQGVFSLYHGSKGFSSGPWCGLVLALKDLGVFSYKHNNLLSEVYSLRHPEE